MTAKANMDFDRGLISKVIENPQNRWFRAYEWLNPGLTYPENRPIPEELKEFDQSTRSTGGGLVFHSPGDIVLSMITPIDDPIFENKKLRDKLCILTNAIKNAFQCLGYKVSSGQQTQENNKNLNFCQTYYNPHELYINQQKLCGLTLKKQKQTLIIQGVIHLTQHDNAFSSLKESYKNYLPTPQIKPVPETKALIETLFKEIEKVNR